MEAQRTPASQWTAAALLVIAVMLGAGWLLAEPGDRQPEDDRSSPTPDEPRDAVPQPEPGAKPEDAGNTRTEPFEIKGLGSFRLSGPCTHSNLSVYRIHGEDRLPRAVRFATLREALKAGQVMVYETERVNELSVENRSERHVFIQAGDILLGGKQDRVIAYDLVLPPYSGKVPIGAFCVERGRWSGRGAEPVESFNETVVVSGESLKLAARRSKSQGAVWANVKKFQDKLSSKFQGGVRSRASSTSMALTLENKKVKKTAKKYEEALKACIEDGSDVVGFVLAVNGEPKSANIYASHDLFLRLWPDMLASAAVEAIAEYEPGKKSAPPPRDEAMSMLVSPPGAKRESNEINDRLTEHVTRYGNNVRFETQDEQLGWTRAEILVDEDD